MATKITEKRVVEDHKSFGLIDAKGAEIGFTFVIWQFDYVEESEPSKFSIFFANTKNGKPFGRSPTPATFDNIANAIAYGNKKRAEIERKANKKARAA